MKVRFTRRASDDLASILEYLDERSPQGARSVQRAIRATIDVIGQFPEGGWRVPTTDTRVARVGRYPYLIYWTVMGEEAWLVHIRHAARRPWSRAQSE